MSSLQTLRKAREAARKLSPKLSPSSLSKLSDEVERLSTGAPHSAHSIPSSRRFDAFALNDASGRNSNPYAHHDDEPAKSSNPGAVVRPIGTSRRVFLINHSLDPVEIDGLAVRIRAMASNDGINSVILANPMEDATNNGDMTGNATCVPAFMEEAEADITTSVGGGQADPYGKKPDVIRSMLHERYGDGLGTPYVSSGYDARKVHESGIASDRDRLERELMAPLAALSRAVRGSYDVTEDSSASKVPLLTFPHGLVTDAGYALCLGSYVLATHSTSFQMLNPLRGLAFDPVGLSYLLPRAGWEFDQASAHHSRAVARIVALTGYQADAEDMVATGLATHYVGGPYKLNLLERCLMDLNSYECQALHPRPKKLYGRERERKYDINEIFGNVAVANVVQHVSEYDAAGADEYGCVLRDELDETGLFLKDRDPSAVMPHERNQLYGELESDLVNWAATFRDAFAEPSVEGTMERLREIAATAPEHAGREGREEDLLVAEQAKSFVTSMERRSPLALCVANEVLRCGAEEGETPESCMDREGASQARLFARENGDFRRWAESGAGAGLEEVPWGVSSLMREREDLFEGWAHASVGEVSEDEVKEIVGH